MDVHFVHDRSCLTFAKNSACLELLQLFLSFQATDLSTVFIVASSHSFGSIPFAREALNIIIRGLAINVIACWARIVGTPSGPGAFLPSSMIRPVSIDPH